MMFLLRIRRIKRSRVLLIISLVLFIAQSRIGIDTQEIIPTTYAASEDVDVSNHSLSNPSPVLQSSQSGKPEQSVVIQQVQVAESLPTAIIDPKQDQRVLELDQIVHPITTVTEFLGGQEERNRGSGFVVGNRFFTVNHNLTTSFPSLRVKSTSFIDGMSVEKPFFADEEQDVAVFDLPGKLCRKHCNTAKVAVSPILRPNRKVYWLRKFQDEFILKEATIVKSVTFGDMSESATFSSDSSCNSNSVVLVDQPFIPGSSGSPVMDSETRQIVGVIQGSVDDGKLEKGYFKPINCVLAMLNNEQSVDTLARL